METSECGDGMGWEISSSGMECMGNFWCWDGMVYMTRDKNCWDGDGISGGDMVRAVMVSAGMLGSVMGTIHILPV